ncbi:hypothetical protein LOK49_Contig121G00010 [Camellia lanceoleosa]|nr:hypothetical protein LOK49_Contig121G00010 [Camellia lanceoleosa]
MANQERNTEATDDAIMSSSSDYNLYLPMDIIFDILNRHPVKSLPQFSPGNPCVDVSMMEDYCGGESNWCDVTLDVHFQNDLGLDSFDNVEIVWALEEKFDLEIPNKETNKIDSCFLTIE